MILCHKTVGKMIVDYLMIDNEVNKSAKRQKHIT